jgi:hypothetical protein
MPYEVSTAFSFGILNVKAGDVIEIKTDWDGSHYSCRWELELFYAELES